MMSDTTQKGISNIITWALLTLCCILLLAILLVLYQNNQAGEYRFFKGDDSNGEFYIFDAKSGQVWSHKILVGDGKVEPCPVLIDYGTPTNPSFRFFGIQPKLINKDSGMKGTSLEKDLIRLSDISE